jgi:hypothetical protein
MIDSGQPIPLEALQTCTSFHEAALHNCSTAWLTPKGYFLINLEGVSLNRETGCSSRLTPFFAFLHCLHAQSCTDMLVPGGSTLVAVLSLTS